MTVHGYSKEATRGCCPWNSKMTSYYAAFAQTRLNLSLARPRHSLCVAWNSIRNHQKDKYILCRLSVLILSDHQQRHVHVHVHVHGVCAKPVQFQIWSARELQRPTQCIYLQTQIASYEMRINCSWLLIRLRLNALMTLDELWAILPYQVVLLETEILL